MDSGTGSGRKRKFFDTTYVALEKRKGTILACILLWSVISFLVIRFYFLGTVIVHGPSMLPTLHPDDKYLVHRWTYMLREPKRGEIAVLRDPLGLPSLSVKRVVALPGERIRIRDKRVYVDDVLLEEPYLDTGIRTAPYNMADSEYVIEDGHYFVLGDNRPQSEDSRSFGAVPRKGILGVIKKPEAWKEKAG